MIIIKFHNVCHRLLKPIFCTVGENKCAWWIVDVMLLYSLCFKSWHSVIHLTIYFNLQNIMVNYDMIPSCIERLVATSVQRDQREQQSRHDSNVRSWKNHRQDHTSPDESKVSSSEEWFQAIVQCCCPRLHIISRSVVPRTSLCWLWSKTSLKNPYI